MHLFTIGYTGKSAERFFSLLETAGVRRLLDARLGNRSQLAGFTKCDDLAYFLRTIARIEYRHETALAPTREILDAYRESGDWAAYEACFNQLLAERRVETAYRPEDLAGACLLCAEPTPEKCHRRLVAEYLAARIPELVIRHI